MALFGNIEDNIIELFKSLVDDKDFLRLLSIDSPDCMSQEPTSTFYELFNNRLEMKPKVITPTTEESTFVSIWLRNNTKSDSNNIYQYDSIIMVDIMCHLNLWLINGNKIRPYRMVDLIEQNFRDVKIKGIRGTMNLQDNSFMQYSGNFMGYRLIYKYTGTLGRQSV